MNKGMMEVASDDHSFCMAAGLACRHAERTFLAAGDANSAEQYRWMAERAEDLRQRIFAVLFA